MSGAAQHRRQAGRIECEAGDRHRAIGVHAEGYPLCGSTPLCGSGHGVDVYAFGPDEAPLVAGVRGRKNRAGFNTLERVGEHYLSILRRDHADPMILLPWRIARARAAMSGRGRKVTGPEPDNQIGNAKCARITNCRI
jgi:hypothetical protein